MANYRALPKRQSIRLAGFDYASDGAYFVTLVSNARLCLFGEIHDERLRMSRLGEIAAEEWLTIAQHRPSLALGPY